MMLTLLYMTMMKTVMTLRCCTTFPYSRETADSVLFDTGDVHEDQDVDHVVHLSSMEVDSM